MEKIIGREKAAKKITFYGMIVNLILLLGKIIAGFLGKSAALVSDGIHSLSDFISDIVVIIGFKITSKPADEKHNYGHGKVETISAAIIGLFLIIVSVTLLRSSATDIYNFFFHGKKIEVPKLYVIYVIIFSIIAKEILFHTTRLVGKKIKSEVLIANAWHHRSDALSSVAALIGVSLAIIFGKDFAISDSIASFLVSVFIFKVGFDIISTNYRQLIDESLSKDEVKTIEELIKSVSGIKGYHNIKTRKVGYYVSIDVHIFVDKALNVEQAHSIASALEDKIYEEFGKETFISVHVEPFYPNYPNLS